MQTKKKVKIAQEEDKPIPQKVWLNFITNQNVSVGRSDVPLEAGPKDFQEIVNQLLPEGAEEE